MRPQREPWSPFLALWILAAAGGFVLGDGIGRDSALAMIMGIILLALAATYAIIHCEGRR